MTEIVPTARPATEHNHRTGETQWQRQRIIIAVIATALIVAASVAGVRTLLSSQPAPAMVRANVARELPALETTKISPAKAEGPDPGFFIGTGDGGNGFFSKREPKPPEGR
jgi:hypothetical protein